MELEKITIDLGDEYETALTGASQEEIIDLAGNLLKKCFLQACYLQFLCYHSYSWFPLDDEPGSVPRLSPEQGPASGHGLGRHHKSLAAKSIPK